MVFAIGDGGRDCIWVIGYGVLGGKGVLLAFEDLTSDGCSTIGWWPKFISVNRKWSRHWCTSVGCPLLLLQVYGFLT